MKNPGYKEIADFTSGDKNAFALVYKNHFGHLYYFVKRIVINDLEAQDITAETFIKLWHRRESFDSYQNIKAFLFITARNACLDYLRYQQRLQVNQKDFQYVNQEEMEANVFQEDVKLEVLQLIRDEIENLPTQCQRIFKMAFVENLKNAEIAENLQLTLQTVKNQKVRAIKLLRLAVAEKDLALASLIAVIGIL